jgi:hypothetical protein
VASLVVVIGTALVHFSPYDLNASFKNDRKLRIASSSVCPGSAARVSENRYRLLIRGIPSCPKGCVRRESVTHVSI